MKIFKAFSLIEIMVVLAIVGIVAVTIIPIYKEHTYKTQVSKVVNRLESLKTQMIDSFTSTGSWPYELNGLYAGGFFPMYSNAALPYVDTFYYNIFDGNKAMIGFRLMLDTGDGVYGNIYMLLVYDGQLIQTHCGSADNSYETGAGNVYKYFPEGCRETDLAAIYSLAM